MNSQTTTRIAWIRTYLSSTYLPGKTTQFPFVTSGSGKAANSIEKTKRGWSSASESIAWLGTCPMQAYTHLIANCWKSSSLADCVLYTLSAANPHQVLYTLHKIIRSELWNFSPPATSTNSNQNILVSTSMNERMARREVESSLMRFPCNHNQKNKY